MGNNNLPAWLRNAINAVRSLVLQIGAALGNVWNRARTGLTSRWRRGADTGGRGEAGPQAGSGAGNWWQKITAALVAVGQRLRTGRLAGVWARVGRWGQGLWTGLRRATQWAGRGVVELWQLIRPLFGRLARRGVSQTNLIIRKIGVKRQYRYTLDPSSGHQLLADFALAVAVVVGLGLWPKLQFWSAQNLPAALAPHNWAVSLIAGVLPLIVVYLRWQQARQSASGAAWDLLTLTCAAVGVFVVLFAGVRMFTAVTAIDASFVALGCALIAALLWLAGESTNAYAILIRRPYRPAAIASLAKSLFFILSGWLVWVYLLIVHLLANIQLDSADFLAGLFGAAAGIGLLIALGLYLISRFSLRLPNLAST